MHKTFGYLLNKEPSKPISCSGSRYRIKYELKRDGNNLRLVEVGKIDVQEQIASYEDSVDLGKMIQRFRNGDQSALNKRPGQYIDVSMLPNDARLLIEQKRAELLAQMNAAAAPAASSASAAPVAPAAPAAPTNEGGLANE